MSSDPTKYFEYSLKHASVLIRKEKKSQVRFIEIDQTELNHDSA